MPLTVAERDAIADAENDRLVYISLHTADPSTTGASESTGGSPAYARKLAVWGASASGTSTAAELTFDLPASTVTHFGTWSALTAGTFRGGNALTGGSQVFTAQGQLKLTVSLPVTAT